MGEYNVIHHVVDIYQELGKINPVTKGDANERIDKTRYKMNC